MNCWRRKNLMSWNWKRMRMTNLKRRTNCLRMRTNWRMNLKRKSWSLRKKMSY